MEPGLKIEPRESIALSLRVTDPDVIAELSRRESDERERFALAALRIGVLAVKQAGGALDERALRDAGREMVTAMQVELSHHREKVAAEMAGELRRYFDKQTGSVSNAIADLTKSDGQLEKLLGRHLGGDASTLARTLTQHVGEQSPLLRVLSPVQKDGILAQLGEAVKKSLEEQRKSLLTEFDMNRDDSALSRLIRQVKDGNANLGRTIDETVGRLAKEFSLDNEQSSLVRFKKEVSGLVEKLAAEQREFQARVGKELTALTTARSIEEQTPRKGATFETALGQLLQAEALRAREQCFPVGNSVGVLKHCRKGDYVLEFGPDSAAPGQRVVVEAKNEAGFQLQRTLEWMAEARPNRIAQYGVFVWARGVAPPGQPRFQRVGEDILVIWDHEDPASDLYVLAALEVARALTVRRARQEEGQAESLTELETAITQVGRDAEALEAIRNSAASIRSGAERIGDEADKLQAKLRRRLEGMRESVEALRPKG